MKRATFSQDRRQVILAGFASLVCPAALNAAQLGGERGANTSEARGRLVLSGRVVRADGKPLAGAAVELWQANAPAGRGVTTDGDGRFVALAATERPAQLRYRVTHGGQAA